MSNVAIIPARSGSKRIPRKNVRPFNGRPIISYCIETALQSQLFDEVMVSTDDEEIAIVAKGHGATVPFLRSQCNASDYSTTADVLCEVLIAYESVAKSFDLGCCLYPTALFITTELLIKGKDMLLDGGYDSVFPVVRYSYPIQRALELENGRVKMIWPDQLMSRSQDLRPSYHDGGQFYWFRTASLIEKRQLWTENSGAFAISEMQAHDIDTADDWDVAEFKYRYMLDRRLS